MRPLYRKIANVALCIYIGIVGGNIINHGYESWSANRESQKSHYGSNLSQQWSDYSTSHLERIANLKTLIPFSGIWNSPERPLQVRVIGTEVDGIELKFDVGNE